MTAPKEEACIVALTNLGFNGKLITVNRIARIPKDIAADYLQKGAVRKPTKEELKKFNADEADVATKASEALAAVEEDDDEDGSD